MFNQYRNSFYSEMKISYSVLFRVYFNTYVTSKNYYHITVDQSEFIANVLFRSIIGRFDIQEVPQLKGKYHVWDF